MLGRGKCCSAWGSLPGKEVTQELGCWIGLGGSFEPLPPPPSWIPGGLRNYLLEQFVQIKPPCPLPGAPALPPLCPPPFPLPCPIGSTDATRISTSQSVHHFCCQGAGSAPWGVKDWTGNKPGECGQLEDRGFPPHHRACPLIPTPGVLGSPSSFAHTPLGSSPATLGPDAHCRGQLVPWEWVGEAGKSWGSWGAGLGVGVGKKLGWAPGTSWAMSRGSSREAK